MPVSARFHTLRDRVVASVDQAFAEPVRLSFMKDGKQDPGRPVVEIEAILRVGGGKEVLASGKLTDNSWHSKFAGNPSELYIDRSKYPTIVLRAGDRVKALSRNGEPWFEVLTVQDRGEARLILTLGEV